MDIPIQILDSECDDLTKFVAKSCEQMQKTGGPAAILVKKNTFSKYGLSSSSGEKKYSIGREEAIRKFCHVFLEARLVATTGMPDVKSMTTAWLIRKIMVKIFLL